MIKILEGTTKYPLQKIGEHAGICWNSDTKNSDKNKKRAIECIKSGHGRVLEFVDVEIIIEGYSARVIREWYTHIAGGPTRLQESTRYVDYDGFDYVIPQHLNEEQLNVYADCMADIHSMYRKLQDVGIKNEDAALILPLGMTTKIVDKRNLRNLVEMSHQRLCNRANWEYRKLMRELIKALADISDEWQWIVDNLFKPKCQYLGYCPEKKSCGKDYQRKDNNP